MSAIARNTDPITSHEAAQRVRNISLQQKAILNALRDAKGTTDIDLCDTLAYLASPQSLRSRRAELVRMGKVRPQMQDGQPVYEVINGRRHTVWEEV